MRISRLISFLCLGLVFFGITPIASAEESQIRLEVSSGAVVVGDIVEVGVYIDDTQFSLDTVRVALAYPSQLSFVAVSWGDVYNHPLPIVDAAGSVSFGAYTMQPELRTSSVFFATVVFRAVAPGEAMIKFVPSGTRLIENGNERFSDSGVQSVAVDVREAQTGALAAPQLFSASHPSQDRWYQQSKTDFYWSEREDIVSYAWAFNADPATVPTRVLDDGITSISEEAANSGLWYGHLRGKLQNGQWTDTAHYLVRVDDVAPEPFTISADQDQLLKGETATLQFLAVDTISSIDHYEMAVNNGPWERVTAPVRLHDLPAGDYTVKIKAVDIAGNAVYAATTLRAYVDGADLGRDRQINVSETKSAPKVPFKTLTVIIVIVVLVFLLLYLRRKNLSTIVRAPRRTKK